jgi:hypothetical protein
VRSFRRNRRGQVRVIEAFFASVLLLSSLALIPAVQRHTSDPNTMLSSRALNVLASLDADGNLARLVDQRNWTALKSCLESALPAAVWFNITVFDENLTCLNGVLICSGGAISDHVDAVDYLCPSTSGNYAVYMLRLQLAGLD